MTTSTQDILVAAMQNIGATGIDRSALESEENAVVLRTYNQVLGMLNLRRRNAYFVRTQSWAFSTARDSYTIGASADSPNFAVTAGGRPVEILDAKIVNTDVTPNIELDCAIWTFQQYKAQVNIPTLASGFPRGIYYSATMPNGTIYPYPANPTHTSYKLQLAWADQFLEVAYAEIGTTVRYAPGAERLLTLETALALTLFFPCSADRLRELKEQLRRARADYRSQNEPPAKISTTDGMQFGNSAGWNWISRR